MVQIQEKKILLMATGYKLPVKNQHQFIDLNGLLMDSASRLKQQEDVIPLSPVAS